MKRQSGSGSSAKRHLRPSISKLERELSAIPQTEERFIRDYVESQAAGEHVTYLEKVKEEHVLGTKHEIWDVKTDVDRYWVITNPTNLYSQNDGRSIDYALTMRIGVTARLSEKQSRQMPAKRGFPLDETWLRWQKTAEALHNAEEVDDFQAVGVRCRECLLSCVRAISPLVMIPDGHLRPKAGDFVHWAELITELMIPNQGYDEVRNYLKSMSKTTWQMAN
jgi:hypothetical protein